MDSSSSHHSRSRRVPGNSSSDLSSSTVPVAFGTRDLDFLSRPRRQFPPQSFQLLQVIRILLPNPHCRGSNLVSPLTERCWSRSKVVSRLYNIRVRRDVERSDWFRNLLNWRSHPLLFQTGHRQSRILDGVLRHIIYFGLVQDYRLELISGLVDSRLWFHLRYFCPYHLSLPSASDTLSRCLLAVAPRRSRPHHITTI